jgi:hypothetical protein
MPAQNAKITSENRPIPSSGKFEFATVVRGALSSPFTFSQTFTTPPSWLNS